MSQVSFWEASFLWRDPLIAASMGAVLCAFLGVYVVLKRSAFVGAAVSQSAGLGVVLALLAPHVVGIAPWPLGLGLVTGSASAALFALPRRVGRVGVESTMALAYVLSAAFSLLLGTFLTQEYEEVHSLLFGDAVTASAGELWALGSTLVVLALVHVGCGPKFLFVSFDPETARAMGMPVKRLNALLYLSVGLGVAVATRSLGALPSFALTVIPACAGLLLLRSIKAIFVFAVFVAVGSALLGYYLSFIWSFPAGATIVVTASISLVPGAIRRLLGS